MVRILIADDHDIVRSGLRRILESHSNWEVVAEAGDGGDAIRKAVETRPDIAVIDYSLPRSFFTRPARTADRILPGQLFHEPPR